MFLLTREQVRHTMALAHTNSPRLQHITEPILTEPNRTATSEYWCTGHSLLEGDWRALFV